MGQHRPHEAWAQSGGGQKECANLDLWQDGQKGGGDAEKHVDADEDLVLSAAVRVGVVDVEHGQSHHRQQVVDRRD